MAINGPTAAPSHEIILSAFNRKTRAGVDLTLSERMMALSAVARMDRNYYGPSVTEMEVSAPALPERVQGAIASAKG